MSIIVVLTCVINCYTNNYNLYKLIGKNENTQRWEYNEEYDKIMRELISKL